MKKTIFLLLLVFLHKAAFPANWIKMNITGIVDRQTIYIDKDSFKINYFSNKKSAGFYITAWTRTIYSTPKIFNKKLYNETLKFNYFDCQNNRFEFSDLYYAHNGVNIHFETSSVSTKSSSNWLNAFPGSFGEMILHSSCNLFFIINK